MNSNIEVINENLWAVNMQYVKLGYINIPRIQNRELKVINLTNQGVIVLDKDAKSYEGLKLLFLKVMDKSDEELNEMVKNYGSDSFGGFVQNVVGWEIKRRCAKAEYINSHPIPGVLDKLLKIFRKKVNKWHQYKQE